jgi:hypothetical protein
MSIKRRDFLKVAVAGSAAAALPARRARPTCSRRRAVGMLYDAVHRLQGGGGCRNNDMPVENADQSPIWDTRPTPRETLNIIRLPRRYGEVKDRENDGYSFVSATMPSAGLPRCAVTAMPRTDTIVTHHDSAPLLRVGLPYNIPVGHEVRSGR